MIDQEKTTETPRTPRAQTSYTPVTPRPRTYEGVDYYGAEDVAKILGVTRVAVLKWEQKGYFTADRRAHDGRYLYTVERVMQLKSVYRPDWNQPAYLAHADKPKTAEKPAPERKKYPSKEERQKVRDAVRMIDPDTIAGKINLEKTRIGWVCPECGNGRGSNKTGIVPKYLSQKGDHVEWYCFACGSTCDNIALVAKVQFNYSVDEKGNFTDAKDFPKALEDVANLFGVYVDTDGAVHSPHAAKRPEIFDDANDEVDESTLKDYSNFYGYASGNLKYFMSQHDGFYRGIPKIVYDYFWCGYVSEFGNSKTPRFIVPTSRYTFLARFTGDKEKLSTEEREKLKEKWRPRGVSRPPFNIKRAAESDDSIIGVTEGEFDAISVFFASVREEFIKANGIISLSKTPRMNTIALMSTSVAKKFYKRLRADEIGKKFFIVMLDNDEAGIKATPHVVKDLKMLGHDAVGVLLSEKYNDANEFLQADPDAFTARIKEIYDAAKSGTLVTDKIFSATVDDKQAEICAIEPTEGTETPTHDISVDEDKNMQKNAVGKIPDYMKAKIAKWEADNGKINPVWLKEIFSEVERIENAELTPELINDPNTQNSLGSFLYFSFLVNVYTKFFDRLRDAKKAAKSKVRTWERDYSMPMPTEYERFLSTLNITNIVRKVDSQATATRKLHEEYLDCLRQEELNKKREAERRAYISAPPTTKKFVPDCPVDLRLPEGIFFSDEGIQVTDLDKPAKDGERIPVTACENPVVPTKIFREPEEHTTNYEVAVKTGKCWRHVVFDGQTLQSPRGVDILGNFGAHISDNRMMAKYFSKIIALNEKLQNLTEVKSYKQPGWSDDTYTKFIWPTGGEDYIVGRKDFNYKKIFAPKGDADELKQKFLEAMVIGGAIVRTYVGFALVAPLIRPLSLPNLQVQMHGLSGDGKTALEKLTAALFGDPVELIATFASTNKNRLVIANAFNDLPTFIDELETVNGKKAEETLPQTIYGFSLGKGNQANKRDGTAREPFYFAGTRLYSGERPMLKNHDQRGAFKRLLQLECKRPFQDKFAAEIHVTAEGNHGHFGRQWVEFVKDNLPEIRKQYTTYAVSFPVFFKAYEPSLVKAVVAANIAMQYFKIFLGEQDKFDDHDFDDDATAIIKSLPTLKEISSGERALTELRSFVDGHPKYFVCEYYSVEDNKKIRDYSAKANETYGKIFLSGEVAIYPAALRKILEKELGFASAAEILTQWEAKGDVLITGKDRKYQHKISIMGSYKWTHHFYTNILAEARANDNDDYVFPPDDEDEEYDDEYYESHN